jgi:hypothetical protein
MLSEIRFLKYRLAVANELPESPLKQALIEAILHRLGRRGVVHGGLLVYNSSSGENRL